MNHRTLLTEILIAFGEYYDRKLTTTQIAMYVEDLTALTPDELRAACKLYRQDPKNDRFPLPAKLIALVRPVASAEDIGRDTAAAIIDAVHRAGNNNSERAREIMGELGWAIVARMGGWACFCQELTNENLTTYRAQIRDLAATMHRTKVFSAVRTDNVLESKGGIKAIEQVLKAFTMPKVAP